MEATAGWITPWTTPRTIHQQDCTGADGHEGLEHEARVEADTIQRADTARRRVGEEPADGVTTLCRDRHEELTAVRSNDTAP